MERSCERSGNRLIQFALCLLLAALPLGALEISQGGVRLVLHENTGRFSLYGRNAGGFFESFLSDKDPLTSFIEINMNDRIYRLGDSSGFGFRVEAAGESPLILFESDELLVRIVFSFIKTAGSRTENGVQITIRLRNLQTQPLRAGVRVLLDTCLGEESGVPFFINKQGILAETLIMGSIGQPWVSRGRTLSLMGSIGGAGKNPDYLQFAGRGKLTDASWRTADGPGRNAGNLPHFLADSAVCFYYEPVTLPRYGETDYVILLAAEDPAGFDRPNPVPAGIPAAPARAGASGENSPGDAYREADLALLRTLISRIDQHKAGQINLTEEELASMERTITGLRARYNLR
jgi:hypothetical protein